MTPEILMTCTGCPKLALAADWLTYVETAMTAYEIDTSLRQAHFLANVGHESGGMVYTTELWGPTATQRGYEGRADLGNKLPGDGKVFRGHGLIQMTGRFNHARVRDRLQKKFPDMLIPDFEQYPSLLAQRDWAALSAADFWDDHEINKFADVDDFDGSCDTVNRGRKTSRVGDSNGWDDRLRLYLAAKVALRC